MSLLRTLRDDRVWEALSAPRRRSEIGEIAQLMWAENEAAAAVCDVVLDGPAAWWPQHLRKTHGTSTAGMVRELLRRMPSIVWIRPADALQLAAMAMEIAEVLQPEQYPAGIVMQLRGQALRDHASVLSFTGRIPEALACLERAARAFEHVPVPDFDLARLAVVKASALRMQNRTAEAAALAHDASDTFLLLGDRRRYVDARIIEAAVVYDGGAVEKALEIWRSVEDDPILDEVARLRLTHNIALCLHDLHRPHEAVEPLRRCVAGFERVEMPTERNRSRWNLGNALLGTAAVYEAIAALRASWQEFLQKDMAVDAALCGLDLAEALLAAGRPKEIPAICHEVVALLTKAGLAARAITALALLREAAAMGKASRDLVRRTQATVKRVTREVRPM